MSLGVPEMSILAIENGEHSFITVNSASDDEVINPNTSNERGTPLAGEFGFLEVKKGKFDPKEGIPQHK